MKALIAKRLRYFADRIDPDHAPRAFGAYWNHTPNGPVITKTDGIRIHPPVPGCPLWYMTEDYDRSWEGMP